ncbi:MAG: winged helix-turn-helix domain-containing protein [Myxococcota bacterium]
MTHHRVVRLDRPATSLTALEHRLLSFLALRDRPAPLGVLLSDVWGYHPRSRSRAPYVSIQRLREKIEVDPTAPQHLVNRSGQGYELVPATVATPQVTQPVQGDFVGRANEMATLRRFLDGPPGLLTVVGPGGMGKTRLVREALQIARSGTLQVWVELGRVRTEDGLLAATLGSYGLVDDASRSQDASIALALQHRGEHIVVFDAADLVTDGLRTLLERAFLNRPNTHIVVTSRRRLNVPHEQVLVLEGLGGPEAVKLMLYAAKRPGVHWRPNEAERRDAERLAVDRLDGLPLALELAGRHLALMSVHELSRRIGDRFSLLQGESTASPWSSLRSALMWSVEQLDERERSLLAQLGVFRTPFTLASAQAVIPRALGSGWLERLRELVECSLVDVTRETSHAPRFGLLDSVRELARELLESDPAQLRATHDRHLAWVLAFAEPVIGADAPSADIAKFSALEPDVCQALQWARQTDRPHEASTLAVALRRAAERTGRGESGRLYRECKATWPLTRPTHEHWARLGYAVLASRWVKASPDEHAARIEATLRQCRDSGQRAWILSARGWLRERQGDFVGAMDASAEALEEAKRVGLEGLEPRFRLMELMGRIRCHTQPGPVLLEELRQLEREVPRHPSIHLRVLFWMGRLLNELEDPRQVIAVADRARRVAEPDGHLDYDIEIDRAEALTALGRHEESLRCIQRVIELAASNGHWSRWVRASLRYAYSQLDMGNSDEAEEQAILLLRGQLPAIERQNVLALQGQIALQQGRFDEAASAHRALCSEQPGSWAPRLHLACDALRRHEHQEALSMLDDLQQRGWALAPHAAIAVRALTRLAQPPLTASVLEEIREASATSPSLAEALRLYEIAPQPLVPAR